MVDEKRHFAAQLAREKGIVKFLRRHGGSATVEFIEFYFGKMTPYGMDGNTITRLALEHLQETKQISIDWGVRNIYISGD